MEEQESKASKKKWITFVDGTIIALALTVVFVTLSFAYNGGYNYYFGIPQFFTTASWGGIIYRMPQVSQILIVASILIVVFNFIKKWIVYANEKKSKETNLDFFAWAIVLFLVFVLATTIYLTIKNKSIILLVSSLLTLIEIVYIVTSILKHRKLYKNLSTGSTKSINQSETDESGEYYKRVTAAFEENRKFREVIPNFKPIWISNMLMIYSLIFILCFYWGTIAAGKQTSFYFMDNETVITSVYDNNVLAISVSYDQATNKYRNTGVYKLIPQENLTFKITNCGTILSDIKQDEIKVILDFD